MLRSLARLAQPFLQAVDPERAHDLAIDPGFERDRMKGNTYLPRARAPALRGLYGRGPGQVNALGRRSGLDFGQVCRAITRRPAILTCR